MIITPHTKQRVTIIMGKTFFPNKRTFCVHTVKFSLDVKFQGHIKIYKLFSSFRGGSQEFISENFRFSTKMR